MYFVHHLYYILIGEGGGWYNCNDLLHCIIWFSLFYYRKTCSRDKKDEDEDDKKNKHESKLDAKFFSFTTFYYLVNQKKEEK